ncbi:MAG: hypothetical protein M1541_20505, partial [Acidobacteria bacterium]|nr:hypothetical protein [Acidobacteriota bacterium]
MLLLCGGSACVQYSAGSPGGLPGYLCLASVFVVTTLLAESKAPAEYFLSLSGLVELWLVLEYVVYATFVSTTGLTKVPTAGSPEESYRLAYLAGAAAVAGFGCGLLLARRGRRESDAAMNMNEDQAGLCREAVIVRRVMFAFVLAGIFGLYVLVSDPNIRQQLLYERIGFHVPAGMGRYVGMVFILPTTAVAYWYAAFYDRRFHRRWSRAWSIGLLLAISLMHLLQGRRLIWICTVIMIFHLLRLDRSECGRDTLFRLRGWHIALAMPLLLLAFAGVETSRNRGWLVMPDQMNVQEWLPGERIVETLHNAVGRFDVSAAMAESRDYYGYLYGRTFGEAPLQALPLSMRPPGLPVLRRELGELIYNSFLAHLVSQEVSLPAELHANFGMAGVFLGMALVGWSTARLDAKIGRSHSPLGAIGYGLCLFRVTHHLV